VAKNGLTGDGILALLKTGLCGAQEAALSALENYVYTWRPHAADWRVPFTRNPAGMDAGEPGEAELRLLELANGLRARIVPAAERFRAECGNTGRSLSAALYRLLLAVGAQDTVEGWTLIFSVIGAVVTLLGIAGFFLIEDHVVTREENKNFFGNIFYGFRPGVIRKNMSLYGTLILLALFNISIQIFMPYLILYYTESLGFENYVLIFAPAIALSALFTGLYGKVYDRKGFTMAIIPTLALLTVGYVGLIFVRSMIPVFLFSLLMMCGFLGTGAMLGARVRDCTPEGKAGMFQGLRIIGQVLIPGVIGPAIGAWLLRNAETMVNTDGTTSFIPNESIFIGALVAAGVVWLALSPLFFKKKEV
jgi:hypothetical protein